MWSRRYLAVSIRFFRERREHLGFPGHLPPRTWRPRIASVARRGARELAEDDRRHAHLAWWRFAIAAAAVAVLIWLGRPGIPWLLLAAAAFVAVAIRHAFVGRTPGIRPRVVVFYERGLRRLDGTWQGTGETG